MVTRQRSVRGFSTAVLILLILGGCGSVTVASDGGVEGSKSVPQPDGPKMVDTPPKCVNPIDMSSLEVYIERNSSAQMSDSEASELGNSIDAAKGALALAAKQVPISQLAVTGVNTTAYKDKLEFVSVIMKQGSWNLDELSFNVGVQPNGVGAEVRDSVVSTMLYVVDQEGDVVSMVGGTDNGCFKM